MAAVEAVIGVGVAVAVGAIMLTIVTEVLNNGNFTGLTGTITGYVPALFAVGLMIVAVGWALVR